MTKRCETLVIPRARGSGRAESAPPLFKEPHRAASQQRRAARQRGLVYHHSRRMDRVALVPIRPFVGDAEEEHRPRHLFEHVGEIFRAHDRLVEPAERTLPEQFAADRLAQIDRARIAGGDREACGDGDRGGQPVGRVTVPDLIDVPSRDGVTC